MGVTVEETVCRIGEIGIVPVVRARSVREARLAADAICAGGIPILEITMTVPNAPAVIRDVVREFGGSVLTGAGTVTSGPQAKVCLDAGAQFLVSPGFSVEVMRAAASDGVLAIPGVLTPTEIIAAQLEGATLLKIFPCGNLGGARYIKALRGPFPGSRMIPTGGVSLSNVSEFITAGAFALGVGSELINEAALDREDVKALEETARKFLVAIQQARSEAKASA